MTIRSKFLFYENFFCFDFIKRYTVFSAQAQEQSYVPNARQAVQKSRMQQPQYYQLTNGAKNPVNKQQDSSLAVTKSKRINYQLDRLVAIDAPKRRGKKSGESTFAKLADNNKW